MGIRRDQYLQELIEKKPRNSLDERLEIFNTLAAKLIKTMTNINIKLDETKENTDMCSEMCQAMREIIEDVRNECIAESYKIRAEIIESQRETIETQREIIESQAKTIEFQREIIEAKDEIIFLKERIAQLEKELENQAQ